MKKRKHIFLKTLLVLLVLFGALAFWQRGNLRAALQGVKYSPEEIEQQLAENHKKVQQAVEANADITVRDLTEEEKEALRDGTQSREEIIEKLIEPTNPPDTQEADAAKQQYQQELSALIAEVYVMQAEYNNTLSSMVDQAKLEYGDKPESERTSSALVKWAGGYVSRAAELEKECDAKMDEVVSRMTALINEYGGDASIVDKVIYTYANEKSLKKSWYLSEMQKRGLLG